MVGPGDKRGKGEVSNCHASGTFNSAPYQFQALKHVTLIPNQHPGVVWKHTPKFGFPTHPVKVGAAQTMQAVHENFIPHDDCTGY
jgi:hypothetical protein